MKKAMNPTWAALIGVALTVFLFSFDNKKQSAAVPSQYITCSGQSETALQSCVQTHMRQGYTCAGGVAVSASQGSVKFYQAMQK